jgi:hypothetical protein
MAARAVPENGARLVLLPKISAGFPASFEYTSSARYRRPRLTFVGFNGSTNGTYEREKRKRGHATRPRDVST